MMRSLLRTATLAIFFMAATQARSAQPIYAVNSERIIEVDPATGDRTTLSDINNGTGVLWESPGRAEYGVNGQVYVVEPAAQRLVRVDPETGNRQIVSDSGGVGTGPLFDTPSGLALSRDGVWGHVSDTGNRSIIRIELSTGTRYDITDKFTTGSLTLLDPVDLATEYDDAILALDAGRKTIVRARLGLSPLTEIVTGAGVGSGTGLVDPRGMAISRVGDIFVADYHEEASSFVILKILPSNGTRLIVSSLYLGEGSSPTEAISDIAIDQDSRLFVADSITPAGTGSAAIYEVSVGTGNRTVISSSTIGTGPLFGDNFFVRGPRSLAVQGPDLIPFRTEGWIPLNSVSRWDRFR